jgi:hypothetical protein
MSPEANMREAQERELQDAAFRFDLVEALEQGGRSVSRICRSLGYEPDPHTLLVTYLVTLCSHAKLPGAELVFEFQQDGVLDRLADDLLADAAEF